MQVKSLMLRVGAWLKETLSHGMRPQSAGTAQVVPDGDLASHQIAPRAKMQRPRSDKQRSDMYDPPELLDRCCRALRKLLHIGGRGLHTDEVDLQRFARQWQQPYDHLLSAILAKLALRVTLLPAVRYQFGRETYDLWRRYFNSRPEDSYQRLEIPGHGEIGRAFANHPATSLAMTLLMQHAADAVRNLYSDPEKLQELADHQTVHKPLSDLVSQEQLQEITDDMVYCGNASIPGNIAGGVGSSPAGPDRRTFSGTFELTAVYFPGAIVITIVPRIRITIDDSIDFYADANPGDAGEQLLSVPLSQLEAYGRSRAGWPASWGSTHAVPFRLTHDCPEGMYQAVRLFRRVGVPRAT